VFSRWGRAQTTERLARSRATRVTSAARSTSFARAPCSDSGEHALGRHTIPIEA
jgi:hypothetical protein